MGKKEYPWKVSRAAKAVAFLIPIAYHRLIHIRHQLHNVNNSGFSSYIVTLFEVAVRSGRRHVCITNKVMTISTTVGAQKRCGLNDTQPTAVQADEGLMVSYLL